MLKRVFKIIGIILGVLVVIIAVFYTKVYISTENRINTVYNVTPQEISFDPTDSALLAYGQRMITTKGCNDCHGEDLGGKVFVDDMKMAIEILCFGFQ